MAPSLDARNPRKRQRDYKREHQVRLASKSRKAGLTVEQLRADKALMREARGHKDEKAEKAERRAKVWQKYGVSPEKLARLRRAAAAHVIGALARTTTKGVVDPELVKERLKLASGARLEEILTMDGQEIIRNARKSYFEASDDDPDMEDDYIAAERNPLWYHSGS